MPILTISPQLLRPRSLPGGPTSVERSAVSGLLGARLAKYGLLGAGILLFGPGLILLGSGADHAHNGLRVIFLAFGLLGWGIAIPLRYSVDLHRKGSVRSLLTTHSSGFAERVSHAINEGLANLAAMPTYRIDTKARTITADPDKLPAQRGRTALCDDPAELAGAILSKDRTFSRKTFLEGRLELSGTRSECVAPARPTVQRDRPRPGHMIYRDD